MASDAHSPTQPRLILASASPRRGELLREAGFTFTVHAAGIDEEQAPHGLLPAELAPYLAFQKAREVAQSFAGDVVLAADTVVAFGDRALGKPADTGEATRMLALLAGTTHIVITGVCVLWRSRGFEATRSAMSAVRLRPLTPKEIETYVQSGQWQGKAGGYGIQDQDPFVTNMSGSHSNIVGLPMELTREMLAKVGIYPAAG